MANRLGIDLSGKTVVSLELRHSAFDQFMHDWAAVIQAAERPNPIKTIKETNQVKNGISTVAVIWLIAVFLLLCCTGNAQDFSFKHKSNIIELSAVGGSLAADGFTSPWNRAHEANPLARPFVSSAGGRVAYFGASFGGIIAANKLLANRPKIRHTLNWTIVSWETGLSINNIRNDYAGHDACARLWITQGVIVAPCHR